MPVCERFQRIHIIHMSLSIGASAVAIVSAVFAALAFVRTSDLQRLYEATRYLELRLTLTSPKDGAQLQGTPVPWTGALEIRPSAITEFKGNATLELAERGIQIVPFVRPVSSHNLWWAQSAAALDANGALSGVLNLGESQGSGVGLSYDVVLISVPVGAVKQGQRFADLPQHSAGSSVVTVTRVNALVAYGAPLHGSIGKASGPNWQSAYMDLDPPRDFKRGERLQIKLQGTAEWVRVRLLPHDAKPEQPTGLIGEKMRVPPGGVLEVVLQKDYPRVKQVSVHAGKEAWGELIDAKGGEAIIVSID